MAVTLAQAKLNVQDALQAGIIDEFRKSSYLMDNLTFDDCVSPTGGGATLTYGYTRLVSQPTADFRSINSEYTPSEVSKQRYTVDLKVFGGAFEIDRVIADMGGIVDEVALQSSQKIKAATALFNDTVINGNSSVNADAFDGLDVALTGSDTEFNKAGTIDLSTITKIQGEEGQAFALELHKALGKLDGTPTAIMCNSDMKAVLEALGKYNGRYNETKDDFGKYVATYGGVPIIDLGAKAGSNDPVVGIDGEGKTSIYFARFGLDGFHAISIAGKAPAKIWLPDFSTAGAVKKGEVEMIAAVALKSTKAAGVFRNVKIA
jgi:hypothetical protein